MDPIRHYQDNSSSSSRRQHYRISLPMILNYLINCLTIILFISPLVRSESLVSNDQVQTIRKLSSLRSFKDAQFFRYQIPSEISTAIIRLNASQSEVPINITLSGFPSSGSLSGSSSSSSSWAAATPPPLVTVIAGPSVTTTARPSYFFPPPTSTPTPPGVTSTTPSIKSLFNTTILTVYQQKAVKFYRSLLSTSCKKPLDVTFVLRWGSLPLLSIKNATTPENFLFDNKTEQFRVQLKTDSQIVQLNLTNPMPGDWYAVAYINQINERISQKGLERECFYRFMSNLQLERLNAPVEPTVLPTSALSAPIKQSLVIDHQEPIIQPELFYKFMLSTKQYGVKIVIKDCQFKPSSNLRHHSGQSPSDQRQMNQMSGRQQQSQNNEQIHNDPWSSSSSSNMPGITEQIPCPIEINYRAQALPSSSKNDFSFRCQSNQSTPNIDAQANKCVIDLPTYSPDQWNYIQIVSLVNEQQQQQQQQQQLNLQSPYDQQSRTKLNYGSINFTIQLLAGQDAFLYNFFSDQQCSSANSVATTVQPSNNQYGYNNNNNMQQQSTTYPPNAYPNYGKRNEAKPNINNNHYTTMSSNIVSPPKLNAVSPNHQKSAVHVNGFVDSSSANGRDSTTTTNSNNANRNVNININNNNNNKDIGNKNKVHSIPYLTITSTTTTLAPKILTTSAPNDPTEDYDEDDDADAAVSPNQFHKRSADPGPEPQQQQQGGFQNRPDRKKSEKERKKEKEERRLKKMKNKNRQKNKDQCQFDPAKILATLEEDDLSNMTSFNVLNLTRYQSADSFEFRYSHLNATNLVNSHNLSSFIEIDNERATLANFTVVPQFDIGGSLTIDFAISPLTNFVHQNVCAILCLTHNRLPPVYSSLSGVRFDQFCDGILLSNTSVANFSSEGSTIRSLVVPYPRPGTWFVSIVVRCYTDDDTLDDPNLMNYVEYSGSCDYYNRTSILLDVRSSACHNSRCMNGGKCLQYLNGGILYSTCSCRAGWKGLICNDGSEALSDQKLLINFLLLTISNTAFIPAVIVAACRKYFTESAIYLITMLFSTLYHACDSDYAQAYCVLSPPLLQFADFYTAILSFFVTLITLANLSDKCKSFLHLLGAISIALITQNDRTSLWTFVIPAGLATLLLFCCWCSHCCRRTCYPPARCWLFSICPSLILTVVGLIIYAFFETQDNYAITHSIWHGIIGVALLFAIPSMPSNTPAEGEEEDDERVHFMSSSSSSGAGSGKGTGNKSNHPETYYELIGEEASHLARTHPQGVPVNASSKHISTKTY